MEEAQDEVQALETEEVPVPLTEVKSASEAEKHVLAIPELFHLILLHLPLGEILTRAMRVCKAWHDSIENSRLIQQVLFLQPFPQQPNIIRVVNPFMDGVFRDYRGSNPKPLGPSNATWRKMLVCQPPIDQITAVTKSKPLRPQRRVTPIHGTTFTFGVPVGPSVWGQDFEREAGVKLSTRDKDGNYALDLRFLYGDWNKGHVAVGEDHWQWKQVETGMDVLRHLGRDF